MSFRVMTWNVENLFPPGSVTSPSSHNTVSQQDFDAKIAFLAEAISARGPDVVALQEVGGADADDLISIEALQSALDGDYPHRAVSGAADGRRIKVAFISKLALATEPDIVDFPDGPFHSLTNHEGKPAITRMGRGALSVEVEPTVGVRVRLVTVHLKSKLLTFPRPGGGDSFSTNNENLRAEAAGIALLRRTAEAVTVRTFLNDTMEANPEVHTVVLGDFNDGPEAATSQIFLGPTDRDITTADSKDPVRLYNLTDSVPLTGPDVQIFLPQEERFTRISEGRGEILDQILASRGLIIRDGVFRVEEVRSFVGLIEGQSVTNNPNERVGKEASDHAPVLARFDL